MIFRVQTARPDADLRQPARRPAGGRLRRQPGAAGPRRPRRPSRPATTHWPDRLEPVDRGAGLRAALHRRRRRHRGLGRRSGPPRSPGTSPSPFRRRRWAAHRPGVELRGRPDRSGRVLPRPGPRFPSNGAGLTSSASAPRQRSRPGIRSAACPRQPCRRQSISTPRTGSRKPACWIPGNRRSSFRA